jgi:superfamily II DNA or RNA helicase
MIIDSLLESIQTGFIDKSIPSDKIYRPQLLTNDHRVGKKVLWTIQQELEQCDEFWFSVAFITTGGVATIINTLSELEKKNIKGKVLASQYLNFTHPEALSRLKKFKNIELKIAIEGDFHSKGYLFRKADLYNLIIGSSNLTQTALCSNKEWNLKVSGTKESELINQAILEFKKEFETSADVTNEFLTNYDFLWKARKLFNSEILEKETHIDTFRPKPNLMQREALNNIELLREKKENKALIISATGTGKTYLSAFDVEKHKPKKFLFVVHRLTIAEEAMKTFKRLLGDSIKMGIYSGSLQEIDADYIFSTVQTISKPENLEKFNKNHFDYIVIDETHRAGAESYKRLMDYFSPSFLLGMTATPERTDGADIFKMFDYNIAYEIRLNRALEEEMLCPFHYYGVTDLIVNGKPLDDKADFKFLVADERVDRIVDKIKLYNCDNGTIRGLIFCSRQDECIELSNLLNKRGYNTIALTGNNSEKERQDAIERLESDRNKLDYIVTVDIFNEGVDIPKVNQIIMLRPTQSAIIFIQQLGRGLRKINNKEYLTVIDFIGNYSNNYMIPIALFGDTSYNKDALRKLLSSGSCFIPGTSTINFDKISKQRIFDAIDSANMQKIKDLINDYKLLKFKIGRVPFMVDFLEHGSRDPVQFVNSKGSYYNFVSSLEDEFRGKLNLAQIKILKLYSNDINNARRLEESVILQDIITNKKCSINHLKRTILDRYGYALEDNSILSCINNLNSGFTSNQKDKLDQKIVSLHGDTIYPENSFCKHLDNSLFRLFLEDNVKYAIRTYSLEFKRERFIGGFQLYKKYTRKDVFRILNWDKNPVAQNVGGYIISKDNSNCPIFVTLEKEEDISSTTKYLDGFLNPGEFEWMSKSNRRISSKDVQAIKNYKTGLRLPLFIKKNNDEGIEFYYMGDITPIEDSFEETTMMNDKGKKVAVVKMIFKMQTQVELNLYNYLTNKY